MRGAENCLLAIGCLLGCNTIPSSADAHADDGPTDVIDSSAIGLCAAIVDVGCDLDEKCTFIHPSGPDGKFLLACAPDGSLPVGAECVVEPGKPDDCVGGTLCFWDRCQPLCAAPGAACDEGACGEPITDYPNLVPTSVCYPGCDPLLPECPADYGCYFHTGAPETAQPACIPAGLSQLTAACTWSEECAPGLVCAGTALAPFDTSEGSGQCAPLCDPGADDCGLEASCAEFEEAGYGACVPPG